MFRCYLFLFIILSLPHNHARGQSWYSEALPSDRLVKRMAVPPGFTRIPISPLSFAEWLRNLPLKSGFPPVHLYNGHLKSNQNAHCAVIAIDTGSMDLQQCADAVIRLRAEYLLSAGKNDALHFNFTSGDTASWSKWIKGFRPEFTETKVTWMQRAPFDTSYANFRRYLDCVMNYAGTYSLERELEPVPDNNEMQIGDVFIQGGFPGHAVIVIDMAFSFATGEEIFLLAQSYMPAQEMHILKNPAKVNDPWYDLNFGDVLVTPEWRFKASDLHRFKE